MQDCSLGSSWLPDLVLTSSRPSLEDGATSCQAYLLRLDVAFPMDLYAEGHELFVAKTREVSAHHVL
jgi:hypothetical protein